MKVGEYFNALAWCLFLAAIVTGVAGGVMEDALGLHSRADPVFIISGCCMTLGYASGLVAVVLPGKEKKGLLVVLGLLTLILALSWVLVYG